MTRKSIFKRVSLIYPIVIDNCALTQLQWRKLGKEFTGQTFEVARVPEPRHQRKTLAIISNNTNSTNLKPFFLSNFRRFQ